MTTFTTLCVIGVFLTGASADFYYPDCGYAGMSCLSCDSQKQCINFFGQVTYWATISCSANINNGYSNPYCNPTTNTCTGLRPAGCPIISNYKCLRNGMFPDLNDCAVYYACTDDGSEQFACADNYIYRQEYGKCVFKLSADDCFTVTSCGLKDSVAVYPGDASLYYSCVASALRFAACAETQKYNVETKTCDGSCESVGVLPFTKNCTRYIVCSESASGFVAEITECPIGSGFNRISEKCEEDYVELCNELALLEGDVSTALASIPIFGALWGPVKSILDTFNINPFTLMLKFGLSDDVASTAILVFDYVYRYNTIPPTAVTVIIKIVVQFLPDDIRSMVEMMLQLGGLVSRSGPEQNSLEVYLEDALLGANVDDVLGFAQSLQGKTREEINAKVTRGLLGVFKVPEAQVPFIAQLLAMNTPKIADALNRQLGVPLLNVTVGNEVKLNVVCIDDALYDVVDNIAVKLYPGNGVGELFKAYSRQQYMEHHAHVTNFVDGFSFSFNV